MKKVVCDNYEAACIFAADMFSKQLERKPKSVFGFATGGTPLGIYKELTKRAVAGSMDFSQSCAFNLDEYYPISRTHPQSFYHYMNKNLFSKVKFHSTDIPSGEATDIDTECKRYDAAIKASGGIDLQLLGIGTNGHIGFNEPSASYSLHTNFMRLTADTINANSRFFSSEETQPTEAISMGIGTIFAARSIILLATGAGKAQIVRKLFDAKLHTDVPACFLLLHPDVTLILDKEAAGA